MTLEEYVAEIAAVLLKTLAGDNSMCYCVRAVHVI